MKLTSVKSTISQVSAVPGLLTGQIDYGVKDGKSNLRWIGPKIPADAWNQILAFFRWTFKTHHAESQVRLYVNAGESTWAAWAYPQDAAGYSATKELDNPAAEKQREQFPGDKGWVYLGTVHHHCGMSAFQSGTDKRNETDQDGLHITIGDLNKVQYDIHCRFYLSGCEFNPDMAEFWDVSGELTRLLPAMVLDMVARHQMTIPPAEPTDDTPEFPDQWKANIEDYKYKAAPSHFPVGSSANGNGAASGVGTGNGAGFSRSGGTHHAGLYDNATTPFYERKQNAFKMAQGLAFSDAYTKKEIDEEFSQLENSELVTHIIAACKTHNVDFADVVDEWDTVRQMESEWPGFETGYEHLQK